MTKSYGYYCLRYVGYMLLIMAVLAVFLFAAYTFLPDLAERYLSGNSGVGAVTTIMPALLVGQLFYRQEQRRMTRGEGWSLTVLITAVSFAVSGLIFWAVVQMGALGPDGLAGLSGIWQELSGLLWKLAVGFAIFYVLINRLMLWSGVRGAIKTEERLAAKASRGG